MPATPLAQSIEPTQSVDDASRDRCETEIESIAPTDQGVDNHDILAKLAVFTPFVGISDAIMESLVEATELRSYGIGETVYAQGQYDGSEVFFIQSGRLKIACADNVTGDLLIEEVGKGAAFGLEMALSDDSEVLALNMALTAVEDSKVLSVDTAMLQAIIEKRPSLTRSIVVFLSQELCRIRFRAIDTESAPEQRVFAALLEFVERDGVRGEWRITKMPKHRELAEKADADEGVTASAVAHLIQEGIARRDYPGLVIADMERLNILAN